MDRSMRAGISGFLLALTINFLTSGLLYFIPSFLAAILIIYLYRIETLKDGLIAAFMTYIFNDGILSTIGLATYYFENTPYEVSVDIWLVLYPIANAVTAMIAGYVGIWLVHKMKPTRELPSPPPLPPPMQPI
jgi:hypothetical protein